MRLTRTFSLDFYLAQCLFRGESPNVSPELLTDYRKFISSMIPRETLKDTVEYYGIAIEDHGWCDLCRDYRKVAVLQLKFHTSTVDVRSLLDEPEEITE